jgi:hypothetical protein
VGDAIALDASGWVAQRGIVGLHRPEEGTTLPHHHGDQVDSHFVEQAELEALPRNRAGCYAYGDSPAIS